MARQRAKILMISRRTFFPCDVEDLVDLCAYVDPIFMHVHEHTHTEQDISIVSAFTPRNEGSLLQPDLSI